MITDITQFLAAFGEQDKVFLERLAANIGKEWPGRW
jgi:hypothetical protein